MDAPLTNVGSVVLYVTGRTRQLQFLENQLCIMTPAAATTITVPSVAGQTQAAATASLTTAGLTVGTVTTASSSTVATGSVISQNPLSGAKVAPGSAVSLVVSSGVAQVSVPSVTGQNAGRSHSQFDNRWPHRRHRHYRIKLHCCDWIGHISQNLR